MTRKEGFTVLEMIMVLFVIAAIVTYSVRRIRLYEETANVALVKSDLSIIEQALNHYFHQVGCDTDGAFSGKENPTFEDLGLSATYAARLPDITAYKPQIIDTDIRTKDGKPVYRLQLKATVNTRYTTGHVLWVSQKLGAGKINDHTLTWHLLPGANVGSRFLWVMNGPLAFFRYQQSDSSLPAGSYCAN